MTFQEACLLKTFVAAFEVTNESFGRLVDNGGDASGSRVDVGWVASCGSYNRDLLAARGSEYVSAASAGGNDGCAGLFSVNKTLHKGRISA